MSAFGDVEVGPDEDEVARSFGYRDAEDMSRAERAREDQATDELRERNRAAAVADVDLDACEYDELQRLALLVGVRANRPPCDLVRDIRRRRAELVNEEVR